MTAVPKWPPVARYPCCHVTIHNSGTSVLLSSMLVWIGLLVMLTGLLIFHLMPICWCSGFSNATNSAVIVPLWYVPWRTSKNPCHFAMDSYGGMHIWADFFYASLFIAAKLLWCLWMLPKSPYVFLSPQILIAKNIIPNCWLHPFSPCFKCSGFE